MSLGGRESPRRKQVWAKIIRCHVVNEAAVALLPWHVCVPPGCAASHLTSVTWLPHCPRSPPSLLLLGAQACVEGRPACYKTIHPLLVTEPVSNPESNQDPRPFLTSRLAVCSDTDPPVANGGASCSLEAFFFKTTS